MSSNSALKSSNVKSFEEDIYHLLRTVLSDLTVTHIGDMVCIIFFYRIWNIKNIFMGTKTI